MLYKYTNNVILESVALENVLYILSLIWYKSSFRNTFFLVTSAVEFLINNDD